MDMASVAIIRTPSRFLAFLCALASLTRLTLGCSQDFLDIIGPGVRVKRGPDWKWLDQDGNGLGTLTTEISSSSWITVKWDNGHTNSYRVGHQDKCDLALVDVLETQCNFFPTNMTDTGDFLLSFQDFPRSVHTKYRCHKHIQSLDETKVVALHVLMIDMCNTTIYDGSNKSSKLMETGCMMVSGTYVSSGRDMFIDTFKKLGTKYGFMAYVTYEKKECENMVVIYAEKGHPGFFTSPYSNYTLGSSILCSWEIRTSEDQILEITVTFLDNNGILYIESENKTFKLVSQLGVNHFTSTTSRLTLKYEKDNQLSKGFQVLYQTKDKPKEAYCPKIIKTLEPGESGLIKLPEYNLTNTGSLICKWKLKSKSVFNYIDLTVTRIDSTACYPHKDTFKANGASFPVKGGCEANSFTISGQGIEIFYIANSSNNSAIILEYQNTRLPLCVSSWPISVGKEKGFLDVPSASSLKMKSQCEWKLISPEHQQVSVEVMSQTQTDWEPYNAFKFTDGQIWSNMTKRKITSIGNKLFLRFDISKQPSDFSGKLIVTYTAVSPSVVTSSVAMPSVVTSSVAMPSVVTSSVVTPSVAMPSEVTPSVMTPAAPIIKSSTFSTPQSVECTQPGVPIWCYVVLVLLSLGCVALFITSMTLYRRQIYVCDEHGSLLNLRLQDIIAKDDHL